MNFWIIDICWFALYQVLANSNPWWTLSVVFLHFWVLDQSTLPFLHLPNHLSCDYFWFSYILYDHISWFWRNRLEPQHFVRITAIRDRGAKSAESVEIFGVNLFNRHPTSFENPLFDEDGGIGTGAGSTVCGFLFPMGDPRWRNSWRIWFLHDE